jgi:ABC-type phosphate transport system permease subunit
VFLVGVLVVTLIGALVCVGDGATTTASYLSAADRMRLKHVLSVAWDLQDIPSVHYAVLGYKLLGEAVPKQQVMTLSASGWLKIKKKSINLRTEKVN